ncbi:MAG TPA: hypothetical protein PLA65_08685 [Spirochaetota bacterium]|mgnify:FL=1|nr:hypothetical protein [Spirochaetota bacterium]HPG52685.1 hypothetical protein [Spirochaetota bacterium]HPN12123.1 hypothetical protein [Spirochaetota bacterium]
MEQYDSLNEKTKMVDIAMKYTRGDIIKAKEMSGGQYLDIIVVKCKFLVEKKGLSGMFMAYFNYIHEYIACCSSIIFSKTTPFEKLRIFDDWKALNKDLLAFRQGADVIDSQNFTYYLTDSFVGYDVFPDVQEKNLTDLTRTVTEIIAKSFNVDSVKCQIELESTSSLAMDLAGLKIDMPGSAPKEMTEIVQEDDRIVKVESEAKFVIEGKGIVAPVKGKNVTELIPGDKIMVLLSGHDMVSEKILKMLNAHDQEGGRLPVPGRLKAKIPIEKGGTMLYAVVAKGVLAKIFEEENVKLLLGQSTEEIQSESPGIENKIIYIMAIAVGLIILCGIILFQLL